ncbi:MAG: tRNA lysidine(34) synthetase TilS [Proteobacteria bacterium]|nr:tRNA lysidine(34) synthetase TilS [Pseudomonadota bacterium]
MAGPCLRDRVLDNLLASGVSAADRLAVACSGGPDSAVLADIAMALSRHGAVGPVALVHVDHGLRPDSARDADAVRALAGRGNAAVHVVRVEVDRRSASLERAAREARYAAFDRAARQWGWHFILLAHTASDQAETVLMRVLRGAGVTGVAGIPALRDRYVRPLLTTRRAEIERYAAEHGLAPVRDPMNDDPTFFRSRIRHRWLPALRAENPGLDRALCQLAESARQQRQVLDFASMMILEQARIETRGHAAVGLRVSELARAPDPVIGRALALAVQSCPAASLEARHQRVLLDLVRRPAAGTIPLDLPGFRAVREYDTLWLEFVPGTLPDSWDATVEGPEQDYIIRHWQPGDRMRPARLKGRSRKLSDLFADAKVPRRLRERAIVVARKRDGVIEWAQYIGPAFKSAVDVVLTRSDPIASNNMSD